MVIWVRFWWLRSGSGNEFPFWQCLKFQMRKPQDFYYLYYF